MIVNTPISLGELIDKISILIIKEKKIADEKKNNLIREELTLLRKTLNEVASNNSIDNYLNHVHLSRYLFFKLFERVFGFKNFIVILLTRQLLVRLL